MQAEEQIRMWLRILRHVFNRFSQKDIALDTFPYNGTTTTCEALWMGVPVISLIGDYHVSRVGLSLLTHIGLEFFTVQTTEDYVKKATALAQNTQALATIRQSMRARIAASGLCHAKAFAKDIENAYRKMWHKWCKSRNTHITDNQLTTIE